MGIEPERPIEKLLRACAEKRRQEAGAVLDVPPATRRLLQAEVDRQFSTPAPGSRSWSQWLTSLWPRLALGFSAAAILLVTAVLLWPTLGKSRHEQFIARNEPDGSLAAPRHPGPLPALAPSSAPEVAANRPAADALSAPAAPQPGRRPAGELALAQPAEQRAAAVAGERRFQEAAATLALKEKQRRTFQTAATEAPTPPPAAADVLAPQSRADTKAEATPRPGEVPVTVAPSSPALALAVPRQAATPSTGFAYKRLEPAASPKAASSFTNARYGLVADKDALGARKADAIVQRFARVRPSAGAGNSFDRASPAVLGSFLVQQSGREIRITDNDGSVYAGLLQQEAATKAAGPVGASVSDAPAAAATPARKLEAVPAAHPLADQAAAPALYFRLSGTNRTLNQLVVFTGRFDALTNKLGVPPSGGAVGGALSAESGALPPGPPALMNSRISGKAIIGGKSEIDINALPSR